MSAFEGLLGFGRRRHGTPKSLQHVHGVRYSARRLNTGSCNLDLEGLGLSFFTDTWAVLNLLNIPHGLGAQRPMVFRLHPMRHLDLWADSRMLCAACHTTGLRDLEVPRHNWWTSSRLSDLCRACNVVRMSCERMYNFSAALKGRLGMWFLVLISACLQLHLSMACRIASCPHGCLCSRAGAKDGPCSSAAAVPVSLGAAAGSAGPSAACVQRNFLQDALALALGILIC